MSQKGKDRAEGHICAQLAVKSSSPGFSFWPWVLKRIARRRICPRGTNWQYVNTKLIDGRPFGKWAGSVCFVTRTAEFFTRNVQECIMIVKMRLLIVARAGGALRHEGIPPALVCGSLGSVIPSPVRDEGGCMDQQEDWGLFQHPPKHRWHLGNPEQPQCLADILSLWLFMHCTHKHTQKVSPPVGFGHSVHPVTGSDSGLLQLLVPGPTTPQICSLLLQQLVCKNFCYSLLSPWWCFLHRNWQWWGHFHGRKLGTMFSRSAGWTAVMRISVRQV